VDCGLLADIFKHCFFREDHHWRILCNLFEYILLKVILLLTLVILSTKTLHRALHVLELDYQRFAEQNCV